jgi:hypothetical protein
MSTIRNTTSTRRRGRRAARGVVLLAGLLGGLAALAASGVPAYAANNNSLDFYTNIDGHTSWPASLPAGPGTTYSAPAMVRFTLQPGFVTGTAVAAEGSGNQLEFYTHDDGPNPWIQTTVAGANTTYSAPAMVRFANKSGPGTDIAAEGPGHRLEFYYKYDKGSWHQSTVAGANTTYSAPAMVRYSNAGGNGTEIVAEGPNHQLEFYFNRDGKPTWYQSTVAGTGTTYSAPAIVVTSTGAEVAAEGPSNQLEFYTSTYGVPGWTQTTVAGASTTYSAPAMVRSSHSTEIAAEGSGNQLEFYWNIDGPNPWNQSTVAGPGTTYSAPAMVRYSNTGGTGTEITAEAPSNQLEFYYNPDTTSAWNPSSIAGPGTTYSAPAMVRYSNTGGTSTGTEVTAQG